MSNGKIIEIEGENQKMEYVGLMKMKIENIWKISQFNHETNYTTIIMDL